jgi:hypothetical protein
MAKLNLNTYPYYDDFDEDKNFHRILFKPGFAVQARELTQLQTVLQDQIKRFGDNIFKEGSVISGCPESTNFNVDVVKILDINTAGVTIENSQLPTYENLVFIGRNNGVKAVVKKTGEGSEDTSHKALFLQYISQGTDGTTSTFEPDEIIEWEEDSDTTLVIADISHDPITKGSLFSVGDGIVYANGHFVRHYTQTIVLEKFSGTPSKKVGFLVNEEIITSDDDDTLLDPAQGAFNYTAPGADRYKLSTVLVAYPINEVVEGFFVLYEVSVGKISRRYDRTQYAELNKTLARRTYDESGDYVVTPFSFHIREHLSDASNDGVYTSGQGGDAGKIAFGIEPGKAYVRGFEYELFATKYIDIDKPLDSLKRTSISASTGIGNYLVVNELCGPIPTNGTLINLTNVAKTAVTSGTFSGTTAPISGAIIGTARVGTIEYSAGEIGTAAAAYRLYLYDITMTGGSIADIRGVYYNNGIKDLFADVAITPTTLQEIGYSSYIFPVGYNYVKTLQPYGVDNSFVYKKVITNKSVTSAGAVTVNITGDETYAFSTATKTTINSEIIVIAETDIATSTPTTIYKAGEVINMSSANTTVSVAPQSLSLNVYTPGSVAGSPTVTVIVSVQYTNVTPRTKTLNENRYVKIQTTKTFALAVSSVSGNEITFTHSLTDNITSDDLAVGDKLYDSANRLLGTVASVTPRNDTLTVGPKITLTSSPAYSIPDIPTTTAYVTVAHPNWDMSTSRFTAPVSLGLYDLYAIDYIKAGSSATAWSTVASSGTDVTTKFKVNNGQTDALYDIAYMTGSFAEERRYVIQLDHFIHGSSSSAFFCVDSYPLPTQGDNKIAGEIDWHKIPIYVSSNGNRYDLRDCIDFRNTVANIAASTATLNLATINPGSYTAASKAFTGFTPFYTPHPQEEFLTDVEWNLPRVDRIILDADGNFTAVTGVPTETPTPPNEPNNAMTLGVAVFPPYPSLSPKTAKDSGRPKNAVNFTKSDLQRRYTMSDIGTIEKRLQNLELYTKLSFLEQKTINTLVYNVAGDERFKNGVLVDSFERSSKVDKENPTNNCLVGNGILTSRYDYDALDLELSSSTNVVVAPKDVKVVIRQAVGASVFLKGETATQATSSATGVVEHAVEIARGGNFKWVRLYLTNVSGTFSNNVSYNVTGSTTNSTGVITYIGMTETIMPSNMRPDLITLPVSGDLATLPYVHEVYTENPYASEAISVTNNVVYGYEGEIGLIPAEDIWFEHRSQPQIINHYNTEIIYNEVEVVREITKEVEVRVEEVVYVPQVIEVEKIVEIVRDPVVVSTPTVVETVIQTPPVVIPPGDPTEVFTFVVIDFPDAHPLPIPDEFHRDDQWYVCGGDLPVEDLPIITYVPEETPIIIDEGEPPALPDDSPAPPQEEPPSYGGGGGGGGGNFWVDSTLIAGLEGRYDVAGSQHYNAI